MLLNATVLQEMQHSDIKQDSKQQNIVMILIPNLSNMQLAHGTLRVVLLETRKAAGEHKPPASSTKAIYC